MSKFVVGDRVVFAEKRGTVISVRQKGKKNPNEKVFIKFDDEHKRRWRTSKTVDLCLKQKRNDIIDELLND
jgi:hypothetical protein